MSDPTERITRALASFADWQDEDVRRATFALIEAVNTDLDSAGYIPSSNCDEALDALEEAMDNVEDGKIAEMAVEEEVEDAEVEAEDEDEIVEDEDGEDEDEDEDVELLVEVEDED